MYAYIPSGLSVQNPNHRQNVPGGELVRGLLKKAAELVVLKSLCVTPR